MFAGPPLGAGRRKPRRRRRGKRGGLCFGRSSALIAQHEVDAAPSVHRGHRRSPREVGSGARRTRRLAAPAPATFRPTSPPAAPRNGATKRGLCRYGARGTSTPRECANAHKSTPSSQRPPAAHSPSLPPRPPPCTGLRAWSALAGPSRAETMRCRRPSCRAVAASSHCRQEPLLRALARSPRAPSNGHLAAREGSAVCVRSGPNRAQSTLASFSGSRARPLSVSLPAPERVRAVAAACPRGIASRLSWQAPTRAWAGALLQCLWARGRAADGRTRARRAV